MSDTTRLEIRLESALATVRVRDAQNKEQHRELVALRNELHEAQHRIEGLVAACARLDEKCAKQAWWLRHFVEGSAAVGPDGFYLYPQDETPENDCQ